jgi:hypothetical protein
MVCGRMIPFWFRTLTSISLSLSIKVKINRLKALGRLYFKELEMEDVKCMTKCSYEKLCMPQATRWNRTVIYILPMWKLSCFIRYYFFTTNLQLTFPPHTVIIFLSVVIIFRPLQIQSKPPLSPMLKSKVMIRFKPLIKFCPSLLLLN